MKGRKPTPTALKVVLGNPGKRPIRQSNGELQPQGRARKPAKLLSPEAAVEWDRLAPAMHRLGILTPADPAFFVAYCEAFGSYTRANRKLREQGELVLNAAGLPVRNPWLRVRSDAAAEMRQFGAEFGLSPAIRARFTIGAGDAPDDLIAREYFG